MATYGRYCDWEQFLVDPDTAAYARLVSEFTTSTGMAGTVTLSQNGHGDGLNLMTVKECTVTTCGAGSAA